MYKLSKFNYNQINDEGELLLYNSYNGSKSTSKIINKEIQKIYLNNFNDLEENLKKKLVEKGILVVDTLDENLKLKNLISNYVSPNDLSITISPTEGCNLRCKYCYESHKSIYINQIIKNDLIKYVRNNITLFSGINVNWFGGEPLLAIKDVVEISNEFIKICKFYKRTYTAAMTTNGYLLDLDTFKTMLDANIKVFQITIDGIEEIHDEQRPTVSGKASFNRIFNNLLNIKKLRNQNFHIIIRSNFTRSVFNNMDKYVDMISSLCEEDSRFSLTLCYAAEWSNNIDEQFKSTFLENLSSLVPVYEKILQRKNKINFFFPLDYEDGCCNLGRNHRYFFRPNGEVHKCTICFEDSENIIGYLKNGNIEFNNKLYEKILNSNNCDNLYDCFYAPICKGEVCPSSRKGKTTCPEGKSNLGYYLKLRDNYKSFDIIDI